MAQACLAFAAAACGAAAPAPTHAPVPSAARTRPAGTVTLVVENESPYSVCYIYLGRVDAEPGADAAPRAKAFVDLLGFEGTLSPRASQEFGVAPGTYVLRLEDCDTNLLYEAAALSVEPGANVVRFGGAAPPQP